ncbi:MAG TPA: hypothetical protein VLI04_17435 [Nocardioidaceae bacterium]|nr:hypothetical protein [Nocardioidaceae bacterium]
MFAQVIQGQVADREAVRAAFDSWTENLGPSSIGWLGTTAGVTDDGTCIVIARFEDAEQAKANSDRPEQDQAWAEMSKLFTGEVTFMDSTTVLADLQGDPGEAGFVQVIRGRSSNPDRANELMTQDSDKWASFRPDILGSVSVVNGNDYAVVIYFTSEAEAREAEQRDMPDEMKAQMEEMNSLEIGEPTFLDLKDPWLYSPK